MGKRKKLEMMAAVAEAREAVVTAEDRIIVTVSVHTADIPSFLRELVRQHNELKVDRSFDDKIHIYIY